MGKFVGLVIKSEARNVPLSQTLCVECEGFAEIMHHIIPYSDGGRACVPLCNACHGIVHDKKSVSSSELIKQGLRKTKASGKVLGAPQTVNYSLVFKLLEKGLSYREIGKKAGCSIAAVSRIRNGKTRYQID